MKKKMPSLAFEIHWSFNIAYLILLKYDFLIVDQILDFFY